MEQVQFELNPALLRWTVQLNVADGGFHFFVWDPQGNGKACDAWFHAEKKDLQLSAHLGSNPYNDHSLWDGRSIRAMLSRLARYLPQLQDKVSVTVVAGPAVGKVQPGQEHSLGSFNSGWQWFVSTLSGYCKHVEVIALRLGGEPVLHRRVAAYLMGCAWLKATPDLGSFGLTKAQPLSCDMQAVLDFTHREVQITWFAHGEKQPLAAARIASESPNSLVWTFELAGSPPAEFRTSSKRQAIHSALEKWRGNFITEDENITRYVRYLPPGLEEPVFEPAPFTFQFAGTWSWLIAAIESLDEEEPPFFLLPPAPRIGDPLVDDWWRKEQKREQKVLDRQRRIHEAMFRLEQERRQKAREREERKAAQIKQRAQEAAQSNHLNTEPARQRLPIPPVPIVFTPEHLEFQPTVFPLTDLKNFSLRERAALWWVSNQSDDLLCLPFCKIRRLEYQIRTALRVLGPLRGRALLSDEVGLGKTIEAGLVLKELLTRGMVKRYLVLTVPSLVDQWEEELNDKFGLEPATTNQAGRAEDAGFWENNPGIVASLHTVKQSGQLERASQVRWDLLVVDEAHYLRNRDSQAWQAVNALPRQYLLLLTATPVQNSLEELYNLVTLLQPGQLPTPKEFRARFIDPKRPRQPREPEELRRLLGQVMIRNTRANAGIDLPPRRAETVLFEPDETEQQFWKGWDNELRATLARLAANKASLWGRLLLQAAGSSPAAWREALQKFPDSAGKSWQEQAPPMTSWLRKCELLTPLTTGEGGVVIFTQFLQTQAAVGEYLRGRNIPVFLINGSTPAPERQPITEQFRDTGGALLLTHSGTEGRNLQFSHRLVNFDLPWNPMEIEQRIGRLHRLGQRHPVRIYNFVQAGTLQEHLLKILQEKLNLFELVVGEAGLVLGEKFSSDEFAEHILNRWRDSDGQLAQAFDQFGEELAAARNAYSEVKELDQTLFQDYDSL